MAPAAAEPGIHDAAPTTGTALPPMGEDGAAGNVDELDDVSFPEPSPPPDPGTSVAR